jgi:hypothetical protein
MQPDHTKGSAQDEGAHGVQGDLLSNIGCEPPTKQRSSIWAVPKSSKFFNKAQKM